MPNKYGKGYGSKDRRVTSRTGNQIPNPVEEQNAGKFKKGPGATVIPATKTFSEMATQRMAEVAKKNVGKKIPDSDALTMTRGALTAARKRMIKKGK